MADGAFPKGPGEIRWDRWDDAGKRVPSGTYALHVRLHDTAGVDHEAEASFNAH